MSTFNAALARGEVADFNMVIPNGCDDGEANCKPLNNQHLQFDDVPAREIPLIEASPAFGRNGVIVVTYDEDQRMGGLAAKNGLGSGGHTICFVLSPLAVPGDYARRRTVQRPPHAAGRPRPLAVPRRRGVGRAAAARWR